MVHHCGPACECRQDLDAALAALERSTRLLASTVTIAQSWEMVDNRFANLRVAQAKVKGAMREYLNHLREQGAELLNLEPAERLVDAA
jgi:hypothetical protein